MKITSKTEVIYGDLRVPIVYYVEKFEDYLTSIKENYPHDTEKSNYYKSPSRSRFESRNQLCELAGSRRREST